MRCYVIKRYNELDLHFNETFAWRLIDYYKEKCSAIQSFMLVSCYTQAHCQKPLKKLNTVKTKRLLDLAFPQKKICYTV